MDRERLLKPGEVASVFRVVPKTVTRWAKVGRIDSTLTPGGHRRYRRSAVKSLLEKDGAGDAEMLLAQTLGDGPVAR